MSQASIIVVVTDKSDVAGLHGRIVVSADEYLEGTGRLADADALVVNLCRTTRYGSKGYYVSLLADARGQHVLPSVQTVAGLADPYARFRALQEAGVPTIDAAEMVIRKRAAQASERSVQTLEAPTDGHFPVPLVRAESGHVAAAAEDQFVETVVQLGTCADTRFRRAARAVYSEWPAPLLRMQVVREADQWKIAEVAAASPHELTEAEQRGLLAALSDDRRFIKARAPGSHETVRASIAVLTDASDPFSPSSPETIDRLERVAARMNVHVARLGLQDLRKLSEYDALFVRSHTGVTHPAFQFAVRAEAFGMPVVDATQSTIRCTNKVFIEELLSREGIPTPRTQIITSGTKWRQIEQLGFPFVLKLPDGDFSAAVHKITSRDDFERYAGGMFRRSPLLIAQEWLPTEFDWRIGVLNRQLLFAARYYMARGHWQIRTVEKGTERYGRVQAVARDEAPHAVVDVALRAARLIGDGLYGVDIKESPHGPVVIEVNDNPNLDVGYEDTADGDLIYQDIIRYFVAKVEAAGMSDRAGDKHLADVRRPIHVPATAQPDRYQPFSVTGMELEYPIVDRDLNVVSLVEPAFRILAGHGTSDVNLGAIGFSNEFADHVFELKTQQPLGSMTDIEAVLYEGVARFTAVLRDEFGACLLPTAMHPWFDPHDARLWTRSGLRVYTTYARLFNVRTHGWMNVQAAHVNLPFGSEAETMAMLNACSLLIPYLPAIAASSPMHDGKLQDTVDARMAWLTHIQARIPESCGVIVPEYAKSFADYRKHILQPMYAALDKTPDTACIRAEFFNTRAAILRFARKALEIRVLDTQECVKMDVAMAAFVRWSLKHLTQLLLQERLPLPDHRLLVADFQSTIEQGCQARVHAPHVETGRDSSGLASVRDVLKLLIAGARDQAPAEDTKYLDLIERVAESGSLSERIRARLQPYAHKPAEEFNEMVRHTYIQLVDCLESNEPWQGRWS
ncbi:MAG TPA: glutamate-cysteine ligase family protein [Longimicrobiales bacterium]